MRTNFHIQAIVAALPVETPTLIAIDGGSGSGKTTLGRELAAALSRPLISLDDYLIHAGDEILDQRGPKENFLNAFDRATVTRTLLDLRASASPAVVEGVYCLRPEWGNPADFKIWIEMPPALRLERMRVRQANTESQMRLWQATEDWYVKTFHPVRSAHLIVDGSTGRVAQGPRGPQGGNRRGGTWTGGDRGPC